MQDQYHGHVYNLSIWIDIETVKTDMSEMALAKKSKNNSTLSQRKLKFNKPKVHVISDKSW